MKRLGLSLAIAAAMGLTACGGSSSSSSTPSAATVSGTASKGIVIDGQVKAFLFDANGVPEVTAIAETTTDENGDYTLTIPGQHKGKPIYIQVTSDGSATMKCDLAAGCDGAAFGESYTLDSTDFSMGAVIPESSGSESVGLTPLTTAAATKALTSIEAAAGDADAAAAIQVANSSVASTLNDILGLTGENAVTSITDVPVVDLTDSTEVESTLTDGDSTAIQMAAINAAVVSAVQDDNAGSTIEQAITTFAEDLAEGALVGNTATPGVTDLAEILADAVDILGEVDAGEQGAALTEIAEDVGDDQEAAEEEAPDEEVDDTPSPEASSDEIIQAKAFVKELRELGATIDNSTAGTGENEDTIENILNDFDAQIDAADMVSSDDADAAMEAMGKAVEAIVEVFDANFEPGENGPTLKEGASIESFEALPINIVSEETGLTVNISLSGLTPVFSVDNDDFTVEINDGEEVSTDVNVTATITKFTLVDNIVETEVENPPAEEEIAQAEEGTAQAQAVALPESSVTTTEVGTLTGAANFNIVGSVQAGSIDLTLENGLLTADLVADIDESDTETGTGRTNESDNTFTLTGFNLDLNVNMDQVPGTYGETVITAANAMSFSGGLDISVASAIITESDDDTNDWQNNTFDETETQTLKLGEVTFDLDGTFGNSLDEFDASFHFEGDASGVAAFSETYAESFDGETYSESDTSSGGETEEAYASAMMSLTFDAKLGGIADEVTFSFEVERTGFDDASATLDLAYPGRTISITADVTAIDGIELSERSLTLSNNDGVVMTLESNEVESGEDDTLTGSITIGGVEYGEIDGDFIFYTDTTFESAF